MKTKIRMRLLFAIGLAMVGALAACMKKRTVTAELIVPGAVGSLRVKAEATLEAGAASEWERAMRSVSLSTSSNVFNFGRRYLIAFPVRMSCGVLQPSDLSMRFIGRTEAEKVGALGGMTCWLIEADSAAPAAVTALLEPLVDETDSLLRGSAPLFSSDPTAREPINGGPWRAGRQLTYVQTTRRPDGSTTRLFSELFYFESPEGKRGVLVTYPEEQARSIRSLMACFPELLATTA